MKNTARQIDSSKTTVLLLAGGDVSHKLPFLRASCLCPALMPINSKPLALYHLEFYLKKGYEVILAVDSNYHEAVSLELPPSKHGYKLATVSSGGGVVDTLEYLLPEMENENAVVNIITTVPVEELRLDCMQVARERPGGIKSWSAILKIEDDLNVFPKGAPRPSNSKIFTGLFHTSKKLLQAACRRVLVRSDLIYVVDELKAEVDFVLNELDWIDAGHEANYHKCKSKLINSRSFNSLQVDQLAGIIKKTSSDESKMNLEERYFDSIPEDLKIFFPRIVRKSGDSTLKGGYHLEYYSYPNLSEYQLYWNLSEEAWWCCFESLDNIIGRFRSYGCGLSKMDYESFHWGKTISRINQYLSYLRDTDLAEKLLKHSLTVNGKKCKPLNQMLTHVESKIKSAYDSKRFSVVHGDLCFNNILYDSGSGIVRLIDPRGSFGESNPGIYGDPCYDAAKLMHSASYHYDYIVNDCYDLRWQGASFELGFFERANSGILDDAVHWLIRNQGYDLSLIKLLNSMLFLSMVPLHSDDETRQLALFVNGINALDDLMK